jgi:hypothetical protein
MKPETKRAIEERSNRMTVLDEQLGRIGPSAMDFAPELTAMVGLAQAGDKRVARLMLRVVADFLSFRRVLPEPLSSYVAESLRKIASGDSADKALNLERGGRATADQRMRNARVFETVERIRVEQRVPLRNGRGKDGAFQLASAALRADGVPLSPKRVEVIHQQEKASRAAVAAFVNGTATPRQLKFIEENLSFLLGYQQP